MRAAPRLASGALTIVFCLGALAVGGGLPVEVSTIVAETRRAADNAAIAKRNTRAAVRSTEALADIARHVRAQQRSSKRMLEIQLDIEASSRSSATRSERIADELARLKKELEDLTDRFGSLTSLSERAGAQTQATAAASGRLRATLGRLLERFEEVTRESSELNRKARGYDEIADKLP
ncbi:MAG: hypothetical protein ACRDKZ_01130 [Actinomycetota bacterium]